MALVAKRNQSLTLPRNERGQISIFFSASLVVFISIIAFVINVGLFVKAKINLQNATDAAAFAGAAVQARQLTKIAYLNWEMRNIYKEWMYKYYVVGSLNTPMVEDPNAAGNTCGGQKCMDFRLADDVNAISGATSSDPYNFPAVCIHIAGSETNVCKRFAVPGLPEFGGYSIPGTEEASRSFIDALIGGKINDCVERSKLNMLVATTWAYNIMPNQSGGSDTLAGRGPAILSDRQGAWPKAVEMAIRIRNLEFAMNREAVIKPVCASGGNGCDPITNYENANMLGNERLIKAFYSGYRNLGNHVDNEMKSSFQLTELPPKKFPKQTQWSNSSLLIPNDQLYEKQYVDLRLMTVNLATFYAALIPRADSATSGACDISKVAIPVPGYPLGYYKSPDVLTYYAVRGQAEFEGMFNPFSVDNFKLTAYAAAKPFGGRIGPMLFTQGANQEFIRGREVSSGKFRSLPYVSALDVTDAPNRFVPGGKLAAGEFAPGAPLPVNVDPSKPFWIIDKSSAIGGLSSNSSVMFGIPNLVYDYITNGDNPNYSPAPYVDGPNPLFTIVPAQGYGGDKSVGLYNFDLFKKFRGDLSGTVTPEMLTDQIRRVRAPTFYEAANYLIPTPTQFNLDNGVDSFGVFRGNGSEVQTQINGLKLYTGELYAPLHKKDINQVDVLYRDSAHVRDSIIEYMKRQQPAMQNYVWALNKAAIQTYQTSFSASAAAQGAQDRYEAAAKKISDIDVKVTGPNAHTSQFPASCDSLSGQFWQFYYGDPEFGFQQVTDQSQCPRSLLDLLNNYFAATANDPGYDPYHYKFEYSFYEPNFGSNKLRLYSGYTPGPFNGIGEDGKLNPPGGFPSTQEIMRRNFYSTKLVTLNSLQSGGNYDEKVRNFVIHSEGDITTAGGDIAVSTWANPLDASSIGIDLSSIEY